MSGLVLSLFPGIGLLDMAFEQEGFCVVRGPDVLWGGDIRRFHPPAGRFDGVIGGPPCQSFSSLVHLVRANGHEPKFGNLIPEFERVVEEAKPRWFLMENVRAAPIPKVRDYATHDFLLNNAWLPDTDGMGQEQERLRRFTFGISCIGAVNLMRWIQPAALMLPERAGAVVGGTHGAAPPPSARDKVRRKAVLASTKEVPVAIGGSGKRKITAEQEREIEEAVELQMAEVPWPRTDQEIDELIEESKGQVDRDELQSNAEVAAALWCSSGTPAENRERRRAVFGDGRPTRREHRTPAVTSSDGAGKVKQVRYGLADACRLQGLPEDFLVDAPFTAAGKLKAVANGVPLPMGRAIAKAVKQAIGENA